MGSVTAANRNRYLADRRSQTMATYGSSDIMLPLFENPLLRAMISISPIQDTFETIGVAEEMSFEFVQCAFHYLALVQNNHTVAEEKAMQEWEDNYRATHVENMRRIATEVEKKGGKGLAVYKLYCFTFEGLYELYKMDVQTMNGELSMAEANRRKKVLMVGRDKAKEEVRQLILSGRSSM